MKKKAAKKRPTPARSKKAPARKKAAATRDFVVVLLGTNTTDPYVLQCVRRGGTNITFYNVTNNPLEVKFPTKDGNNKPKVVPVDVSPVTVVSGSPQTVKVKGNISKGLYTYSVAAPGSGPPDGPSISVDS